MIYPEPVGKLIAELGKLPGVGPKTAQRLAFHLLRAPEPDARALADAITVAKSATRYCSRCCNITDVDPCRLCTDESRDDSLICVVEEPRDVVALEKTRQFRGRYHVLHGALSPVGGVGPEHLRIKELLRRLQDGRVREIIVATNPNVEGEATALYLARLLRPLGVRVTRLAHGLPVGADIEYADEMTLTRALEGRRDI